MRRFMFVAGTSAFIAALALAAPASAQSLVGEWSAKASTAQGEYTETLTVVEEDGGHKVTITPTGANAMGGVVEATEVVLDGDNFSFKRALDFGQGPMEFAYRGTVEGDTLSGTIGSQFGDIPYSGTRE